MTWLFALASDSEALSGLFQMVRTGLLAITNRGELWTTLQAPPPGPEWGPRWASRGTPVTGAQETVTGANSNLHLRGRSAGLAANNLL